MSQTQLDRKFQTHHQYEDGDILTKSFKNHSRCLAWCKQTAINLSQATNTHSQAGGPVLKGMFSEGAGSNKATKCRTWSSVLTSFMTYLCAGKQHIGECPVRFLKINLARHAVVVTVTFSTASLGSPCPPFALSGVKDHLHMLTPLPVCQRDS